MNIDRSQILRKIKEYKGFRKDAELAQCLGIAPAVLANWHARNTLNPDKILAAIPEINPNWLLTGEGNMIRQEGNNNMAVIDSTVNTGRDQNIGSAETIARLLTHIEAQEKQVDKSQQQIDRLITLLENQMKK